MLLPQLGDPQEDGGTGVSFSNDTPPKIDLFGGFNPSEKYACQIGSSPQVGVEIKNMWNHHPANMEFKFEGLVQMISCQNRDFQVSAAIFRGSITSTNISGFLPSTVSPFIADFESKKNKYRNHWHWKNTGWFTSMQTCISRNNICTAVRQGKSRCA